MKISRKTRESDRRFHTEEAWLEYLYQLRWPEGFGCIRCGHQKYWTSARGLYLCCQCGHQQSVTAGTIFHGTRKPLTLLVQGSVVVLNLQEQCQCHKLLGLGSYQTAWCWLQKLRTCTIFPNRSKLSGSVEIDECFLGGEKSGKRGRGAQHKCKVAVAVERNGRKLGRLRL